MFVWKATQLRGVAPAAKRQAVAMPAAATTVGYPAWDLFAFAEWVSKFEQGVEEAVQEKEGHAAILAALSIQAEFGLPTTCPIYVRDAWIAPGSEHLKQLSLVCTAILKRQAEALTSLPPGKSSMCEKEDLQTFGLLQRVCEHTRCPTAIATDSTQSLLLELKREVVAPELRVWLMWTPFTSTFARRFFCKVCPASRILGRMASISTSFHSTSSSACGFKGSEVLGPGAGKTHKPLQIRFTILTYHPPLLCPYLVWLKGCLRASFALPPFPPKHVSELGLSSQDLFAEGLALLVAWTAELHTSRLSVGGACAGVGLPRRLPCNFWPCEERPQDAAKMRGALYLWRSCWQKPILAWLFVSFFLTGVDAEKSCFGLRQSAGSCWTLPMPKKGLRPARTKSIFIIC